MRVAEARSMRRNGALPHTVLPVMHALGPNWMDPNYLLAQYGTALIWVSLAIIFIECGLLFPILPGDSLLFAIGLFIATDQLPISLWLALILLFVAAFLGNVVGYEIGRAVGPALYRHDGRIIRRAYWDQTHDFFERHGNKTILVARFITGLRVFAALLAGASRKMPWRVFLVYNLAGAILWAVVITILGYVFGQSLPLLVKWVGRSGTILLIALVVTGLIIWRVRSHRKSK